MPQRSKIVSPLALALVLALGFGTVWAALVFWGATLADQATRAPYRQRQLMVQGDGTPLLMSYDYRQTTYYTLAGEEVPIAFGQRLWSVMGAQLGLPWESPRVWTGLSWDWRLTGFSDHQRSPAYWYFVHDGRREGAGYFQGFDSVSELPLGYIGRNGYRAELPPEDDWFPLDGRRLDTSTAFHYSSYSGGRDPGYYGGSLGDLEMPPWIVYLVSDDRLLELNLRDRAVRTVLEGQEMLSAGTLQRALSSLPPSGQGERPSERKDPSFKLELAVRFPDRVLVFHPRGGPQRTYLLPAEARGRSLQFYELSGGRALLVSQRNRMAGNEYGSVLRWIDPQGNVVRKEEVVLGTTHSILSPAVVARWLPAFALPSLVPGAIAATIASGAAAIDDPEENLNLGRILAAGAASAWPSLLTLAAFTAALAWLTWRRQARYAAPRTPLWVAVVLVFGLPGYLGYRLHRRWPVRSPCPACGQNVPRDRDACAGCRAEFPPPAPKGIEVFA